MVPTLSAPNMVFSCRGNQRCLGVGKWCWQMVHAVVRVRVEHHLLLWIPSSGYLVLGTSHGVETVLRTDGGRGAPAAGGVSLRAADRGLLAGSVPEQPRRLPVHESGDQLLRQSEAERVGEDLRLGVQIGETGDEPPSDRDEGADRAQRSEWQLQHRQCLGNV